MINHSYEQRKINELIWDVKMSRKSAEEVKTEIEKIQKITKKRTQRHIQIQWNEENYAMLKKTLSLQSNCMNAKEMEESWKCIRELNDSVISVNMVDINDPYCDREEEALYNWRQRQINTALLNNTALQTILSTDEIDREVWDEAQSKLKYYDYDDPETWVE